MQFLKFCKTGWWYPVVPPLNLTKKLKLSYPVFTSRKTLFWSKKCFSTIFRTFEAVECNFWNFAKLVGGILWSPLCPWQKKLNFLYKFLRVEKHCFDQRKGFQQFLERLKQFKAISEMLQYSLVVSCGPPFALAKKKLKLSYPVLRAERHCLDQRNGFQQFLERLKQLNAISQILQNWLVVSCGPPFALDKKIEIVIPSFYESKDIVLIKEMVFNNFENVWSGLRQFLKSCNIRWWYPVVPPLHLPKKNWNCHTQFYEPKDIVLIKEMVFNNF